MRVLALDMELGGATALSRHAKERHEASAAFNGRRSACASQPYPIVRRENTTSANSRPWPNQ